MEKLGVKKSGVLAVLLIVLFVTSVFSVFSLTTNADKPVIVKIGVISDSDYITAETALYVGVVQKDVNAYVAKLPVDRFNPPVKFEFQVESMGAGNAANHYKQVVKFHNEGINLIIGGWYSSWVDAKTLNYLTNHNMVMISPTSNDPSLAIIDNLFRLLPDASYEGASVASMFTKLGLTQAIVIEDTASWGTAIDQSFTSSFGGTIVTYPYTEGTSIASELSAAESAYGSTPGAGVFLIAVDSDCAVLNSATFLATYPKLGVIPWFGTDGTADSPLLSGPNVAALKILSPAPALPHNTKVDAMAPRFDNAFSGQYPMDYSGACYIDAGWILAQAVIETRPTWTGRTPGASDVIKVLIDDSSRYFGYSGWCQLDKYGDRVGGDWEIWGYGPSGWLQYGTFNYGNLEWIVTPTWS